MFIQRIFTVVALVVLFASPFALAHAPYEKEVVKGTIESIDLDKKAIVVNRIFGGPVTLSFSQEANFYFEGSPVNLSHFKIGDKVRIERRFYQKELQASR